MKIITAWSGTGEFTATHVQALADQLDMYAPFTSFECITNEKIPGVICRPDHNRWPGWWVKMEAFSPTIKGTVLWMDLDTVILGPLDDIVRVEKLTLLRDFYRDGKGPRKTLGLQASLMMLPEEDRAVVWNRFSGNSRACMTDHRGDQPLLENCYLPKAQLWQDVVPDQIVSWKVNCNGGNNFMKPTIPAAARMIIFHGRPRPWDVPQFKELYE